MLFNSIDFAIYLPIVFILYWIISSKNLKLQNLLIVIASYVFYGWWDWKFLSLIIFSTIVDYCIGIGLMHQQVIIKRKILLGISIFINLGFLAYFKYYNFFLQNFIEAFSFFGVNFSAHSLKIILPVGISFYTFQTLSYSIDVYNKKLEPTKDFITFSAFVCFFPQLVAGPIERATNLLPQFYKKREFDYNKAVDGMRQILWGLFKKIVIADNCAEYANLIFNNYTDYSGSTLALGAVFFTFQIYGDFSGYSDIAIGTARLFGFNLMQNFNFPYFSRDIAEFWRKWHISLSTWFRDYIYIPLGGSKGSVWIKLRNTFIVFILSGFWHGANWTYVVWGILNAIYFLPLLLANRNRNNLDVVSKGKLFPDIKQLFQILITFCLIVFAWIFFRANNIEHALNYISQMLSTSFFSLPKFKGFEKALLLLIILKIFILLEWIGREKQYAIENFALTWKRPFRYAFYYIIIITIYLMGGNEQQFIYFQF